METITGILYSLIISEAPVLSVVLNEDKTPYLTSPADQFFVGESKLDLHRVDLGGLVNWLAGRGGVVRCILHRDEAGAYGRVIKSEYYVAE